MQSTNGGILPAGLAIDNNGLITWTPTESQKGIHRIQLHVSDGMETATQDLVFKIGNQNSIIEPIGVLGANVGEYLRFQVNITSSDSPRLSILERPAGSRMSSSGIFTWTPSTGQQGVHTFTIRATDNRGLVYTEEVTIIVNSALRDDILTFAQIHDKIAIAGQPLSFTAYPVFIPEGHAALFSLYDAPAGASIDRHTGIFTWTPDTGQAGQHAFTVSAIAGPRSYSEEITVTVNELPGLITGLTTTHNGATFNVASDSAKTYEWTIRENSTKITKFQGAFTLSDTNRVFERTISNLEPNTVYLLQLTSDSNRAVQVYFKTDALAGSPPVVRDDQVTISEDSRIEISVLANDDDPDNDPIRVMHYTSPSHGSLRRDSSSSSYSGYNRLVYAPYSNYHGQDFFTYTASDGVHPSVTGIVNITVTPVNDPPNIGSIQYDINNNYDVGESIMLEIPASDVDNPKSLTYALKGNPDVPEGARINASGIFTWMPASDQTGRHNIEVVVSDGTSDTSTNIRLDIYENPIALDKRVYTWTDIVHVNITAPEYNRNGSLIETIGNSGNATETQTAVYLAMDYPSADHLVVSAHKPSYSSGETVNIEGRVKDPIQDREVRLRVYAPDGDRIVSERLPIGEDNTFEVELVTGTGLWESTGPYRVQATYSGGINSDVTFQYAGNGTVPALANQTGTIEIFDTPVEYSIAGGRITDIDTGQNSLVMTINSTGDGEMTIDLPNNIIVAKEDGINGNDRNFVVLVDGVEADYSQTSDSGARALTIPFSGESELIRITGTWIVSGTTLDYSLVETGPDTGIFTGHIILTGFPEYDADGDGQRGDATGYTGGTGPTDGHLRAHINDDLDVWFVTDGSLRTKEVPIRWNEGQVKWDKHVYPENSTGVVSVIDPDMNLNHDAPDSLEINIDSDLDRDGIDLTLTETGNATGMFEGTVDFVVTDPSSGNKLLTDEYSGADADYDDYTTPYSYGSRHRVDAFAEIRNEPISLYRTSDRSIPAQSTLSFQAYARDHASDINSNSAGHQLTFNLTDSPPAGATINATTGRFVWTPTISQIGDHIFTIIVYDPQKNSDHDSITITVTEPNQNPVAPDIRIPVVQGGSVILKPETSDPDGDPTTITHMTEPSKGSITVINQGTRQTVYTTDLGKYGIDTINYTVSDGRGGTTNGIITVVITQYGGSPVLHPIHHMTVSVHETLRFQARATDFDYDLLTFAIDGHPHGARISDTGGFEWTPDGSQIGTHVFAVTVSDQGGSDSQEITVRVLPEGVANPDPIYEDIADGFSDTEVGRMLEAHLPHGDMVFTGILLNSGDITYTVVEDLTHAVSEDGTASIGVARPALPNPEPGFAGSHGTAWSHTVGGFLRAGVTINVPDAGESGIANYTFSETGQDGAATMTAFIDEIGNTPPVLFPVGRYSINAHDTLAFRVQAVDFDGTVYYLLSDAPAGATVSEQGEFSWTPSTLDVGIHTFTVIAYDGQRSADSKDVVIRVLPVGTPNESPIAPNMTVTVASGDRVLIIPAISDPDGDPVRITAAVGNAGGIIVPADNGIEYAAALGATAETVTYTVRDSRGASTTGTIMVSIQ